MSLFDNDPFFASHRQQMQRMEDFFQTPFMGGRNRLLGLEDGRQHHHRRRQEDRQVSRRPHMMDPMAHFDSMFSNMRSMMADMHRAFDQAPSDPNTQMYQQSSYYSSSNIGGQNPKVFQATTSVRQIPGGVKETRKAVRDSETGVERVSMGHHINDRAHIIERSRNAHTGESNENQELINIEESEAPSFDQEYQDKWQNMHRGVEQRRRRLRHETNRHHRALPESTGGGHGRSRRTGHRRE